MAVDHLLTRGGGDENGTFDNGLLMETPYLQGQHIQLGKTHLESQQLNISHSTKFLNSFGSQSVKGTMSESKKTNVFIANAPSMLSNSKSKQDYYSKLVKKNTVSNTNIRNQLLKDNQLGSSFHFNKGFQMDVGTQSHMHSIKVN